MTREKFPYIPQDLGGLITYHTHDMSVNLGLLEDYTNDNFSKLVQILGTVGSVKLSKDLNSPLKHYFLAEKFNIRRCCFDINSKSEIVANIYSLIESERRGRAIVDILTVDGQLVYTHDLDYYIIDVDSFDKIFNDYKRND